MNILFKTLFGSHLYGTNTPTSDLDFKGVYLETLDNIILKKDTEVYHENTRVDHAPGVRNTPEDVDVEYKELRRFLKDCMAGQTYALDMLFAPDTAWVSTSRTWATIIANREKLLSKNVEPYIGYCRQQAGKYGLKGSRLGELIRVIEYLKEADPKKPLYSVAEGILPTEFVYTEEIENPRPHGETPIKQTFLNVLGKKFQFNRKINDVLIALDQMNEKYGGRARLAYNNEGIDWKAISHAVRCCNQLRELAQTGKISFPLQSAEALKRIKKGEIPYSIIQEELPLSMQEAVDMVAKSEHLPEKPDYEFWDKFILKTYKNTDKWDVITNEYTDALK